MKNLRHLSKPELLAFLELHHQKKFVATQIWDWIWQKQANTIDDMSNLSKSLRALLSEEFTLNKVQVHEKQVSNDGTIKSSFKLYDGNVVEGVLIPTDSRFTACVSSQVGCSLTCKFCATGQMDRKRNLEFDEIFDQVALINQQAENTYHKRLSNIVYMGMGEPLLNYKNVLKSIDYISSPEGLGMSPSRITVSTAGISKMIKQLGDDQVKFNLAISLHAANDIKRNEIMPINESNNLSILVDAIDYYYKATKNPITFEYILFNHFNDSEEDAKELVKLCRRVPAKVNIIEYNPVANVSFIKPDDKRVDNFMDYLNANKINATIRRSRGKDIDAACGQLANKSKN
jgi:23S rRNA (adenine2503-C2)-methyltransferase